MTEMTEKKTSDQVVLEMLAEGPTALGPVQARYRELGYTWDPVATLSRLVKQGLVAKSLEPVPGTGRRQKVYRLAGE